MVDLPKVWDVDGLPLHVGQRVTVLDFTTHPQGASVGWDDPMIREIGRVRVIDGIEEYDDDEHVVKLSNTHDYVWRGIWLRGHHVGLKHLVQRYQKEAR